MLPFKSFNKLDLGVSEEIMDAHDDALFEAMGSVWDSSDDEDFSDDGEDYIDLNELFYGPLEEALSKELDAKIKRATAVFGIDTGKSGGKRIDFKPSEYIKFEQERVETASGLNVDENTPNAIQQNAERTVAYREIARDSLRQKIENLLVSNKLSDENRSILVKNMKLWAKGVDSENKTAFKEIENIFNANRVELPWTLDQELKFQKWKTDVRHEYDYALRAAHKTRSEWLAGKVADQTREGISQEDVFMHLNMQKMGKDIGMPVIDKSREDTCHHATGCSAGAKVNPDLINLVSGDKEQLNNLKQLGCVVGCYVDNFESRFPTTRLRAAYLNSAWKVLMAHRDFAPKELVDVTTHQSKLAPTRNAIGVFFGKGSPTTNNFGKNYNKQIERSKCPPRMRLCSFGEPFPNPEAIDFIMDEFVNKYPETLFWIPTRAWRRTNLRKHLEKFLDVKNMRMMASIDDTNGPIYGESDVVVGLIKSGWSTLYFDTNTVTKYVENMDKKNPLREKYQNYFDDWFSEKLRHHTNKQGARGPGWNRYPKFMEDTIVAGKGKYGELVFCAKTWHVLPKNEEAAFVQYVQNVSGESSSPLGQRVSHDVWRKSEDASSAGAVYNPDNSLETPDGYCNFCQRGCFRRGGIKQVHVWLKRH